MIAGIMILSLGRLSLSRRNTMNAFASRLLQLDSLGQGHIWRDSSCSVSKALLNLISFGIKLHKVFNLLFV